MGLMLCLKFFKTHTVVWRVEQSHKEFYQFKKLRVSYIGYFPTYSIPGN